MIIQTAAGSAVVTHRLALAVEVYDAVTSRLADAPVRVGREAAGHLTAGPGEQLPDPGWPCQDLERSGKARFKLRRAPQLPAVITLRIDDPARRFVPRRVSITLWSEVDTEAADQHPPAGAYVPVNSRLLRIWLAPGSAYPLPRGATAIRGRVLRGAAGGVLSPDHPVRWPRVTATGPGNALVGWTHGDERGEFLLLVTSAGNLPPLADAQFSVDIDVVGRPSAQTPPPDPADRCADLVAENIPRSSAPPAAGDLDNDLLRGRAVPPGYAAGSSPRPHWTVQVGSLSGTGTDIPFPD
jgi:hypothetical protein